MIRISPGKLLLSKWTAVKPKQKERHFIVTKVINKENQRVIICQLEAVINNNVYEIYLLELEDSTCWQMGWH
jgi:tryptophan-rich hypothetical protein